MADQKIKSYSDTYLYNNYGIYSKTLLEAVLKDPIIDKTTKEFQDVIYEVRRAKISDSLVRILNSNNVVLLDCVKPLPRTFKVFAAKDVRDRKSPNKLKVFIDTSFVIEKDSKGLEYNIDELKLISYLINAGTTMVYHKNFDIYTRSANVVSDATKCFAKCFTFIIDYLTKVSIQESVKVKVLYLSAMYFLEGVMGLDKPEYSQEIAMKVAQISQQEARILDILLQKAAYIPGVSKKDADPFENIKVFVIALRDALHLSKKSLSVDLFVERWMMQFGPGTVIGMEYFPIFSAMITDAYVGGYLNQQKTIEKVCGQDMVTYTKDVLSKLENVV